MSPTLILDQNQNPVLALGAPGGTNIITAVAQTILHHYEFKLNLFDSIAAPRIHQQWKPDVLFIENQNVSPETLNKLQAMGWTIERTWVQTAIMAVSRDENGFTGVSDPRDIGTSKAE